MNYRIVSDESSELYQVLSNVECEVKALCNNGWEPQGGVHVIYDSYQGKYLVTQAMVK